MKGLRRHTIRMMISALSLATAAAACLPGGATLDAVVEACDGLALEEVRKLNDLTPECREAVEEFLAYTQTDFGSGLIRAGRATEAGTGRSLTYLFGTQGGAALSAADYAGADVSVVRDGVETALAPSEYEFLPLAGSGSSLISLSVVIDYSGSMRDEDLDTAEQIFSDLFNVLPGVYSAETIYFSQEVTQKLAFTTDTAAVAGSVKRDDAYVRGSTALYDAIGTALTHLETRATPIRLLVVATDGMENASTAWTKAQVISKLQDTGTVPIVVASLFSDIGAIQSITRNRGAYFYGRSYVEAHRLLQNLYESIGEMQALALDPAYADADSVRIRPAGGIALELKL